MYSYFTFMALPGFRLISCLALGLSHTFGGGAICRLALRVSVDSLNRAIVQNLPNKQK